MRRRELLSAPAQHQNCPRLYQRALFFPNRRPDISSSPGYSSPNLRVARHNPGAASRSSAKFPVICGNGRGPVQLLLANLISNAIVPRVYSRVRVELDVRQTEASATDCAPGRRRWRGFSEKSSGCKPLFTTKNRGDETRGFGLGLAICRKIVALHGGNLSITSELTKGTTVQVDLPSRQIQHVIPAAAPTA